MKPKILIVEDQKELFNIIQNVLLDLDYVVDHAKNGEEAKEKILNDNYSIILTDVQMPGKIDGVTLLEWCKINKPIPVILMTGFSDVFSTFSAYKIGASGFIPKPFKINDLIETVQTAANILINENSDLNYFKIKIESVLCHFKLPYNIYFKKNSTQYMKIIHASESFQKENLAELKQKKINSLYVKKEHLNEYIKFNKSLSRTIVNNAKIPEKNKIEFLFCLGEIFFKYVFENTLEETNFVYLDNFLKIFFLEINKSTKIFDLLKKMIEKSNDSYSSTLLSSIYVKFLFDDFFKNTEDSSIMTIVFIRNLETKNKKLIFSLAEESEKITALEKEILNYQNRDFNDDHIDDLKIITVVAEQFCKETFMNKKDKKIALDQILMSLKDKKKIKKIKKILL
ncbi:MAG: hypothetical protein CL678_12725 [Bdellovibrionaceae bacterium]|nr:hypothetical protein [Pseudobdellovibrionaceae bacterium]|tara:strand:+ start:3372 stop:4565 length:1194 start_codon:yes stop_codon:yes gene_type:complete